MPRLCVVGLSHKTAPIDVRERAAFAEERIPAALKQAIALPGVGEAMLVSTCNRVELYGGVDGADALRALEELFDASVRKHLYKHDGDQAVRHLFEVASSLDSMVVGESQILGQVKQAYALAVEAGTVGPVLSRTLPRAFALAKRVRTETDVARSSASIASVAVDLAAQIFGDLKGRQVLVVGAGKMGDLSARHLQAAGIGELWVVNRTEARAQELAVRLKGQAAPWSELERLLAKVDIVLCSTGAPEPVLRKPQIAQVMKARKGRWLFLIDIAVPRDVEPGVGDVENVYLYDVDGLSQVVEQNRAGRAKEAAEALAMVDEELKKLQALEMTLGVVPTIKLLRAHFVAVAQAEAERVLGKLSSDRDRAEAQKLAEAIVNKLLHKPMTVLKKEAQSDPESALAETVRALFDLHTGHTEEIRLDEDNVVPIKREK